jgi:hypothetical protein
MGLLRSRIERYDVEADACRFLRPIRAFSRCMSTDVVCQNGENNGQAYRNV